MSTAAPIAWTRLLTEAAAIILSILAAFAIDAWWDVRGDATEEREILLGLRAEFEEVAGRLDTWVDFNRLKIGLVERALGQDAAAMSDAAVDSLLYSMAFVNVFDRGGGTLDALLSSGRLELIEDRSVREALARWPDRIEDIHTNDLSIRSYMWGSVLPYMAERGVPAEPCEEIVPFCVTGRPPPPSHRALLTDAKFRSMLSQVRIMFTVVARDHTDARDTSAELVTRIDALLSD